MSDAKHALRETMLRRRNSLSKQLLDEMSEAIQSKVLGTGQFLGAETIAAYHPLGSEVSTLKILASVLQSKRLALPRVEDDKKIVFAEVRNLQDDLVEGRYGIMEPKKTCEQARPDLIIVPGVAWDGRRHRLGYGKGYYDRFLAAAEANSIGLAYDLQVLDNIPYDDDDVRVDLIISEKRVIK